MGCEFIRASDGTAIICSRGQRRATCSVGLCGKVRVASCDYPVERKGQPATCDSPMCERHRHPVGGQPDTDWCEGHYNDERRQRERLEQE